MGQWDNEGGSLCAYSYYERRAILARAVIECDGILTYVAHELGYHRSHIYRLIAEHRVWPVVNKVRIKRLQREAMARRRGE